MDLAASIGFPNRLADIVWTYLVYVFLELKTDFWHKYYTMTNKSFRDYINLIENAQQPVAEGSDELYQQAIRKYVQRVANNYLGGGNAHLYGAGNFDSEMFGVDPKQAEKDFDALFPQYLKKLQGGEKLEETTPEAIAKIEQLTRK